MNIMVLACVMVCTLNTGGNVQYLDIFPGDDGWVGYYYGPMEEVIQRRTYSTGDE